MVAVGQGGCDGLAGWLCDVGAVMDDETPVVSLSKRRKAHARAAARAEADANAARFGRSKAEKARDRDAAARAAARLDAHRREPE